MGAEEVQRGGRAPAPFTEPTLTYWICRTLSRLYLGLRHRMLVEGREHLPKEGAALIVANHQSFLDIMLVAAACPRHICFVARQSLADSNWMAFVMRECGAVLIDRGTGDRAALRSMVEHLNLGDLVVMFPEGTRSPDGRVQEFKRGALMAARKADVPIIPAAIRGSHEIYPRGRGLPGPGRIALRFLPARGSSGGDVLEQVRSEIESVVGDGRLVEPSAR